MEAIRKQATRLREQVARQQQAVFKQFGAGGYGGSGNVITDAAELQQHQRLEKLYISTRAGKHYQRDIVRGVEGYIVTGSKQVEIGAKLSEDSRKYGSENTCTSGSTLSRAAINYGRARAQMEKERGNLLKALGTQVSSSYAYQGAPLEDARHLAQHYDRMRQEAEAQVSTTIDGAALQNDSSVPKKCQIGENVSRKDKVNFLVSTLRDLGDSKQSVYGALDTWAAWEQNFPLVSLKRALLVIENEQQWHRVIQVIKWMLSKGQGMTMGTYHQLIRALDMDHRVEEAHQVWKTKVGTDLHSVPWQLCRMMISIYYRSNMLEELTRLFKGLEAFGRRPPEKSIVQKVANAYELLGLVDEKEKVLEKFGDLFNQKRMDNKSKRALFNEKRKEDVHFNDCL